MGPGDIWELKIFSASLVQFSLMSILSSTKSNFIPVLFFFSFLKKSKSPTVSFPFYLVTLAHPYLLLPKVPSPLNFILGTKICCLKFIVTINESFSK